MGNEPARQSLSLLSDIHSVTAIIDLNDPGWEKCQQMVFDLTGSRIKTELIFIDTQRSRKDNPWMSPGNQTFFKNDFNLLGGARSERLRLSISKETDIFICLTPYHDKRIEKLVKSNRSRIKIGTFDFPDNPFDLIIRSPKGLEMSEDEVMNAIISFIKSVEWK